MWNISLWDLLSSTRPNNEVLLKFIVSLKFNLLFNNNLVNLVLKMFAESIDEGDVKYRR